MSQMMVARATLEQALEALEDVDGPITALLGNLLGSPDTDAPGAKVRAAINALRAALAQQAEPTRSQQLADAGFKPRDTRLECDECGGKFTRQMLPIHKCEPVQEQAEPVQEPVAWMYHGIRHDGTPHDRPSLIWRPEHMDVMSADKGSKATPLYTAPPKAEPVQEPVAWMRVIDEAMVTHHLGVAEPSDDYEAAKQKMNSLLCVAQDIGAYFAEKAEPLTDDEMLNIIDAALEGGSLLDVARAVERKVRGKNDRS